MENRLREYEKNIEKRMETIPEASYEEKFQLMEYHQRMITNFQHERLVHLLIMLFFVACTLGLIGVVAWLGFWIGVTIWMIPLYVLTLIVAVLSGAYIKHYYFLENHIQKLYDDLRAIWEFED